MNDTKEPVAGRKTPWSGAFFSAKYFWVRAVAIVILFLLVHALGWREYTTFLTGTTGNPEVSFQLSAFYGMVYLALYLGCVVVSPILMVAAGLLSFWERNARRRTTSVTL